MDHFKGQKTSLNEELRQVEKKLLSLIQKRIRLLAKIAHNRMEQNKSPVDTHLEKTLWNLWKTHLQGENQRFFRQLFSILNNTSYAKAATSKTTDKPFCLFPRTKPIDFWGPAPLHLEQAKIVLVLTAFSNTETHLSPFPLNDPLIEQIKALNQMGGSISWEENSLHAGPGKISLDNKSIFLGESEFNLYLSIALGLFQAGSCRLTAGPGLKILNIKPLQDFLPQLGARLTSIEPQSYNLPARLECSGKAPKEIVLPKEINPLFGVSLILAAIGFGQKLQLTFNDSFSVLEDLTYLAKTWNLPLSRHNNTFLIQENSKLLTPAGFKLNADPVLSGYLLVLPYILSGQVELAGLWPDYSSDARLVQSFLSYLGIIFFPDKLKTTFQGSKLAEFSFDVGQNERIFPLILALAIIHKSKAIIYHQLQGKEILEQGCDLLMTLGFDFYSHPEYLELEFKTSPSKEKNLWVSPSPIWTLSYALISFVFKGICMENPGSVTYLWPGFWKVFQSISSGTKTNPKEENNEPNPRRRIRIQNH